MMVQIDPEIRRATKEREAENAKNETLANALKAEAKKTQLFLEQFDSTADRRERIATAAMQGMLAADYCNHCEPDVIAKHAVQQADALIAALEGDR